MPKINLSPGGGSFFTSDAQIDSRSLLKKTQEIDGRLYTAELKITPEAITSTVVETVAGDDIVSIINQTSTTVSITASKIDLNGAVTANTYFKINTDGSMEAVAGKIGGFTIGTTKLTAGTTNATAVGVASGETYSFWSGHLTASSAPFRVTRAGALTARSATIAGTSTVGGWSVSDSAITSPSGDLVLDSANNRIYMNSSAYFSANATSTLINLTGAMQISSTLTVDGNTTLNQVATDSVIPNADDTYSLGTSSFRYSSAYLNVLYMKFSGTSYQISRDSNGFLKAV